MSKARAANEATQRYRARMRAQGLRPLQLWAPDTRSSVFVKEFKRQALAVARHEQSPSAGRDEIDALLAAQDDTAWTP